MTTAGNGIDPTVLSRWTGEVMRVYSALDAQKIENMNVCRSIREPLPDIFERAKEAGLPLKAFKAHIKIERAKIAYDRACENATPEDDDDREAFEHLRSIAEDGDLFDHAVKEAQGNADDDDKDLRPRHLQEAEKQRVAENTARLEKGIIGLPGADATNA